MSRGPGQLQRWLTANLPPANTAAGFNAKASVEELAATYYAVECPTEAQCSAVRRALRGLEDRGLAVRWDTVIRRQGDPSRWSQPA